MTKEKNKKTFYLSLVAVFSLLILVAGVTYAFFRAQGGSSTSRDVSVTSNTTDNLSFQVSNDIAFRVTQADFAPSGGSRNAQATATAILTPNNKTGAATEHYYLSLNISENGIVYSSANTNEDPELLLQVFDSNDQLVTLSGLGNQKTVGSLTGYDITGFTGLIEILSNHAITASNNTAVTETWRVVVTLVNLNLNQNVNAGKEVAGVLVISKDSFSRCIENPTDLGCDLLTTNANVQLTSGNIMFHNGSNPEQLCNHTQCTYDFDDPNYTPATGYLETESSEVVRLGNTTEEENVVKLTNSLPNLPMCTRFNETSPEDWGESGGTAAQFQILNAHDSYVEYTKVWINGQEFSLVHPQQGTYYLYVWDTQSCYFTISASDGNNYYAKQLVTSTPTFIPAGEDGQYSLITLTYGYETVPIDANDGSYRYSGADPNNYLCFSNVEATLEESNCNSKDLYRIIGVIPVNVVTDSTTTPVTTERQMLYKVIKEEPLSNEMLTDVISSANRWGPWGYYDSYYNTWESSYLKALLNDEFLTTLGSAANYIANVEWHTGKTYWDYYTNQAAISFVYRNEILYPYYNGETLITYDKVGLINVTDYAYAAPRTAWKTRLSDPDNGLDYSQSSIADNNWLKTGYKILTMSDSWEKSTVYVDTDGTIAGDYYNGSHHPVLQNTVRPVFYINKYAIIDKDANEGTLADPYRIKNL